MRYKALILNCTLIASKATLVIRCYTTLKEVILNRCTCLYRSVHLYA